MNDNNNINHTSILSKTLSGFNRLTRLGKIIIIFLILSMLLVLLYGFTTYMRKVSTYKIRINGKKVVNIFEGGSYNDPGYSAINYKKLDASDKVKVKNNIDFDKVGTYEIVYSINNLFKKNVVKRTINVLKNPIDDIEFKLNGEEDIVVGLNNEYKEYGYELKSKDGKDYSKYVSVISNVNDSKIGEYEVKYIFKINKKEKVLVRNVYVTGDRYTISYNNEYTNKDLSLKLLSNINDFSYFIINDKKIYRDIANCTIKENGKYAFKMVSKSGRVDDINIEISNIDKEAPSGTCTAYIYQKDNKTMFKLDVNDNNKLKNLKYKTDEFEDKEYVYNDIVDEGLVYAYDEAGNVGEINCTYYYAPIMPTKESKVVKDFDSESLKYWVEKYPTYYITHIWVSDAYNQFKVAVKEPFPMLSTAASIMTYESQSKEYKEKAMIGANGSGFVSDAFNVSVGKLIPEWKYSSKSTVVMLDGEIKRNLTNINIPKMGAITYGLKSNGYFDCYNLNRYDDITGNVLNLDRLISDGVKYTFAFSPVLVHKNKVTPGLNTSRDIRQAIGQIDKNNFVIVTNTTTTRSLGFSHNSLARLMHDIGCIEAYNTDGGGSTNLIYKDRETDFAKNLVYTTRNIPDIIYFVEK